MTNREQWQAEHNAKIAYTESAIQRLEDEIHDCGCGYECVDCNKRFMEIMSLGFLLEKLKNTRLVGYVVRYED